MPIIVNDGATFVPAPEGAHAAICVDVIDHGMVSVTFQGKTQQKHMITIVWIIANKLDDSKPYQVRRRYNATLNEKSTLRRDLESWRGRPFSEAERKAFDLENLLAAGCLLNIIHEVRNGTTYANVASIMRLPQEMVAPTPRDYVRKCDRPPAQPDAVDDGPSATEDEVPF
jgi:hypothetical protein